MNHSWWTLACFAAVASAAECTYRANPEAFTDRQNRVARQILDRTAMWKREVGASKPRVAAASELPPRSFIDEEIFRKLARANVPAAAMSMDEEFIRRVTLDLTGRLPLPGDVRGFLTDASADKRDVVIDKLIGSPAFVDKWTIWWGDLLENCSFPAQFDRREDGRNAYNSWIRSALTSNAPLRDVTYGLMTAVGNSYDAPTGGVNFPITGKTSMGPAQDTYDNALVKSATFFLGMAQYDCLLCHNGRGRLTEMNLWGSHQTRQDAWYMAAHFARLNMPTRNLPATDFYNFSIDVSDRATGTYDLNTNTGNRPDRTPAGTVRNVTPQYRDGAVPKDGNWRKAFAENLWRDPMFALNFANRFWREFFGMALVEPFDMLDPDRLDADNPPPDSWGLQATHPVLLQKLAQALRDSDYNMRDFFKLLVQSNAYQMSSRYDGEWKLDKVALFARHYPRRLWAEEIHDAIALGTGVLGNYTPKNMAAVNLAIRLPEPSEPRNDGGTANFLNLFLRGNRDSQPRSQELSILQRLTIMNDAFVTNRVKVTSPGLQGLAKIADNKAAVEEIFLTFLARFPAEPESQAAIGYLAAAKSATDRNTYIEDLVWACINKAEFIFSY